VSKHAQKDSESGCETEEPIYAEISEIQQQQQKTKDDVKKCAANTGVPDGKKEEANSSGVVVAVNGCDVAGKYAVDAVVGGGGGSESVSRAAVVYGLITAKQAAKFVPCNQTLIVRH
jgi:hypothetical protein